MNLHVRTTKRHMDICCKDICICKDKEAYVMHGFFFFFYMKDGQWICGFLLGRRIQHIQQT